MKSRMLLFIITLLSLWLPTLAQEHKLRVITYNIMDGFNFGKDTTRQMKTANWIKAQKPNVVALQELCGYTDQRLKKEASQWGHQFSVLLKTTGYSVGISADRPIKLIERKTEGFWHGMLHVEIEGVDFFVVHLSPDDVSIRKKEASVILSKVDSALTKSKECIVLGDFNASSPYDDDIMKTRPLLLKSNIVSDAKSTQYKHLANNYFDYSVISKFLAFPMIDVCQKYVLPNSRFSYSTPILIGRYRKNIEDVINKRERLDYLMVSPKLALKCTSASIGNGDETGYLSDHYPLIADFTLNL